MLGRMRVDGPRGLVSMSGLSVDRYRAERLALVGEAAHVFPPIGAQGLNLGFRDAAALRDAVVDARSAGEDIGGPAALARYQRSRDLDVRLRTAAVDGLNRTLLAALLPVDLLRGLGLIALSGIGPLRRMVMREGVLPSIGAPRLMRAPPAQERPAPVGPGRGSEAESSSRVSR
jgi:2-octaprenyl-6-methoxyphenol hydroxylase